MSNKHFYKVVFLFIITIGLHSCIVVNCAEIGQNHCAVHKTKMKRTLVGTFFGLSAYGPDERFPNVKEKQNMGCTVAPWPLKRLAIIYHCTACDSAMAYFTKLN